MSTGSFTKNAAEAASDTIASSDSKETTTKLTNGNAAAMNGSVIPILLSLDLETPKKVQPGMKKQRIRIVNKSMIAVGSSQ